MSAQTSYIDDFAKLIYGGIDVEGTPVETTVVEDVYPSSSRIETFKPMITRPTMSKFEFVRVCTAAAKFLYSIPDLSEYVKPTEINDIINPAELAFLLIINGKLNATLDRLGYEKVTMSELKINPIWIDIVKNYFNKRHENEHREILIPYGLISEDQK